MPDYRLYALSPENRIESATDIEACSDEAAVAHATAALADWELWSGRRLVGRAEEAARNARVAAATDSACPVYTA